MKTNSLRSTLLALLTLAALLPAPARALFNSGTSTNTDLGPVTTRDVNGAALLYQQTARYTFSTSRTGDASSSIVVNFGTAGGNGYVIDLYRNDLRIGTTDAYTLVLNGGSWLTSLGETITYAGRNKYYTNGTGAAILPLAGLPAGNYRIILSRSALFGETTNYTLKLRFPSSGTTGGTGGSGGLLSEVANGLDFTSPVAGRTYNVMPDARVALETDGLDQVIEFLYRVDANERVTGIFDWVSEVFTAYTSGAENRSAHQNNRWLNGNETAIAMFAPDAQLPAGTYVLVANGIMGDASVAVAKTWFRIVPDTTGGTDGTDDGGTNPQPPRPSVTGIAGAYSGFIAREGSTSSWGQVDVRVGQSGAFTGTVAFLSNTARLKGTLADGQMFSAAIRNADGEQRYVLILRPDVAAGVIEAEVQSTATSDKWVGSIRVAQYHARRNPCQLAGRCTMTDTEAQELTGSTHPSGTSRATLRVSKAGRFTCAGRLADGTRFTRGGIVHPGASGVDTFTFSVQAGRSRDTVRAYESTIARSTVSAGIAAQMWVDWSRGTNANARQYTDGFFIVQHFESPGAQ